MKIVYSVQVVVLKSIVHEERGIDVIDEQEEIADFDIAETMSEAMATLIATELVKLANK